VASIWETRCATSDPTSMKALQWGWSEGIGLDNHRFDTTGDRMTLSDMSDQPFKLNGWFV
jgi:hypothetical protein